MADKKIDSGKEVVENSLVKIFTEAQEAINAVQKDSASAVWVDNHMDQINPNYIVFYDEGVAKQFDSALMELKDLRKNGGSDDRQEVLFAQLHELATTDIESSHLRWVFKNKVWAITPQELLDDEDSIRTQAEDDEWFDKQREHFRKLSDPEPEDGFH